MTSRTDNRDRIPTFQCIYSPHASDCVGQLDRTTAAAHVIMAAIGGRKESSITVCTPCNSALGWEIEAPLAADLEILRNLLRIQKATGRNRQAPTLRSVPSPIGEVDVLPGGQLRRAPKLTLLEDTPGGFNIRGTDRHAIVRRIMHLLRERGVKPSDDIRARLSLKEATHEMHPQQTMLNGGIGGEAQMRAIAKIGLEYFALCRRTEIHDARLDPVRRFVRLGEASECAAWDARNQPRLPFTAEALGPAYHSVVVWAAAEFAPLIAAVTLFGVLHWTVELAPSWWDGSFGIAHAVDPLRGINLGDRDVQPLFVPSDWKASRTIDIDGIVTGLRTLQAHWQEAQLSQMISASVERCMAEVAEPGDFIEGEPLQRMLNEISNWAVHYHFGMPLQTRLNEEQIFREIEREYPSFCASFDRHRTQTHDKKS